MYLFYVIRTGSMLANVATGVEFVRTFRLDLDVNTFLVIIVIIIITLQPVHYYNCCQSVGLLFVFFPLNPSAFYFSVDLICEILLQFALLISFIKSKRNQDD